VRRVDGQHVGFRLRHFHGPFEKIARRAHGGAHAQSAMLIFRRARIFQFLLDVFDGDEAL